MPRRKRSSYLQTLKFDPKLLQSVQARYLSNVRFPILLILLTVIIGIFAFIQIPRRLYPEIKIPIVIVNTVISGAGPYDVEQLVTIPLERQLAGVDGLDTMTSTSRESVSTIALQFLSNVNARQATNDVHTLVDRVTNLPEDAFTPDVNSVDFEDQPFWTFAISGTTDGASLMRFANNLEDQIEDISAVDRVQTSGLDDQTIDVVLNVTAANEYNISPIILSQLIKNAAKSFPAGIVYSSASSFSLTINREITTIDDIRNLRITTSDANIRLGDIANVSERSKSGQQNTYIASQNQTPKQAIQFFVFKKATVNIDQAFKVTEPIIKSAVAKYDGQFTLYSIQNTSELIDEQFGDLNREFLTTSILVFLLLLLFLGIRQGIISNVTVPLTFLATFAVIYTMGLSLNFLTVFSFLLTLGILIDDTIVVVAAMTRYYKTGRFTPYQTGIMVWKDFIVPLWSSAITTIWGFVPLLLSTGIIGEFIKSIPIVVTTAMLSSTIISVLITIPLMIVFLKPQFPRRVKILFAVLGIISFLGFFLFTLPKNIVLPLVILSSFVFLFVSYRVRNPLLSFTRRSIRTNKRIHRLLINLRFIAEHGLINIERLSSQYRIVIEKVLRSSRARRQTIIAIACFTIFAYLLLPLGLVKNEFFPKEDAELLYAAVDLPSGMKNDAVTEETINIANKLRDTAELDYMVAEVGQVFEQTGDRRTDPDAILFTLHLTRTEKRDPTSSDIAQKIREQFKEYSNGTFSVVELTGGPPAGADIQIQLLGEDLGVLNQFADKIIEYLKNQAGIVNVDKSIKPGTSKVVFVPDKTKLADFQVSTDQIALWLRTYASGFTLDSVLFGSEEEDITFRINSYDNKPLDEVSTLAIPLPAPPGATIPLSALGTFRLETNPTIITRENQKRSISIFGGVTGGANIPEKNAALLAFADSLELPQGYEWKTGGVNEENQKSVQSILYSMALAFLLILITMVIEFGSFRQAFIAMLMIPISVAGVFYIFALLRVPLSFAALIGVLALFGIVMRHAIVVMEKINDNRKHGLSLHDAIADAASSRLEPVLLTSLATIVGLLPITISDPFWRGLGGTIIAGLLFTGALKLFIIPVLYYNFYKDEEIRHHKRPKNSLSA
ncbi:efflux RND transporter permease subunit [Candidatus Gottesmanbacteria bacterium]|nr:efflux RND transporter permease subunit [Candidatus Gottesmanbacteria bacterium]